MIWIIKSWVIIIESCNKSVLMSNFILTLSCGSRLPLTLSRVCPRFVLLLVDICWISGWWALSRPAGPELPCNSCATVQYLRYTAIVVLQGNSAIVVLQCHCEKMYRMELGTLWTLGTLCWVARQVVWTCFMLWSSLFLHEAMWYTRLDEIL